jgi:hypothetical protein
MCLSFRIVFKVKFIILLVNLTIFVTGNLEGLVKRGSLTKDRMHKAMSLLKGALDYSDFKDVDMVIEVSVHFFFESFVIELYFVFMNLMGTVFIYIIHVYMFIEYLFVVTHSSLVGCYREDSFEAINIF